MLYPLPYYSCIVSRLYPISGIDGVDFQYCSMRKAILPVPWIMKESKIPMPLREQGPYLTAV